MDIPLRSLIILLALIVVAMIADPEPPSERLRRAPADILWAIIAAYFIEAALTGH